MKNLIMILISIIALFCISCEKAVIEEREPAIYGIALDENGKPIADAEVFVIPDLIQTDLPAEDEDPILFNFPNPVNSKSMFQFSLKEKTSAKLTIISQATGETISEFGPVTEPGNHMFEFVNQTESNRKFHPGIYTAYLKVKDTLYAKRDFVVDYMFDTLDCIAPQIITKTDKNGNFVLPYKWFPDSTYFNRYLDAGDRVGRFLYGGLAKIVVCKRMETTNPVVETEYKVSIYQLLEIDKTKIVDIECKAKSYKVPI